MQLLVYISIGVDFPETKSTVIHGISSTFLLLLSESEVFIPFHGISPQKGIFFWLNQNANGIMISQKKIPFLRGNSLEKGKNLTF